MKMQLLAKLINPLNNLINYLPPKLAIQICSIGRRYFMHHFYQQKPLINFIPDEKWQQTLWGLKFQLPLFNAAGMFKNGKGYDLVNAQGAGGYLGGTSTYNPRLGNKQQGIYLPFISLPKSQVSLNFFGLPNLGDEKLAKLMITQKKSLTCPIGWSLIRSPDYSEQIGLFKLIKSLWLYHDKAEIDFIEINESCPNIKATSANLLNRLEFIGINFLLQRKRHLPVILKLSNDLTQENLTQILNLLFKYKFDGITLGNTSTNYLSGKIVAKEQKLFNYFTQNFGGGMGGVGLKNTSLALCKSAVEYKNKINPNHEFHVIRCGGINSVEDLYESKQIGVSLNQWFSGYFSNYLSFGNLIYKKLLAS